MHAGFDLSVQDEVTEQDMTHKMLFHEDAEYQEDRSGVSWEGEQYFGLERRRGRVAGRDDGIGTTEG